MGTVSVKRFLPGLGAALGMATLGLLQATPGLAMQSANPRGGFEGGVELGAQVSGGGALAHTIDLGYGFKTSLPGATYVGLDRIGFTESGSDQDVKFTATAARNSLYVMQPFSAGSSFTVAGELGYSDVSVDVTASQGGQNFHGNASSGGGALAGLRGTWTSPSALNVNFSIRHHFEGDGNNQFGIGASGRIKGALGWQADVYNMSGGRSSSLTSILVGVRFLGKS